MYEECASYVIKTLIIPNFLISKTRKKLNIWQTHFGSIFKTSYSKTSTERWLLNLSLKLSLCPDRFPPPGCLILTHIDTGLFFFGILINASFKVLIISACLHLKSWKFFIWWKLILFLVDCCLLHGLTVPVRDIAKMTDNIRISLPMQDRVIILIPAVPWESRWLGGIISRIRLTAF